jgi:hypothetical protein
MSIGGMMLETRTASITSTIDSAGLPIKTGIIIPAKISTNQTGKANIVALNRRDAARLS